MFVKAKTQVMLLSRLASLWWRRLLNLPGPLPRENLKKTTWQKFAMSCAPIKGNLF